MSLRWLPLINSSSKAPPDQNLLLLQSISSTFLITQQHRNSSQWSPWLCLAITTPPSLLLYCEKYNCNIIHARPTAIHGPLPNSTNAFHNGNRSRPVPCHIIIGSGPQRHIIITAVQINCWPIAGINYIFRPSPLFSWRVLPTRMPSWTRVYVCGCRVG